MRPARSLVLAAVLLVPLGCSALQSPGVSARPRVGGSLPSGSTLGGGRELLGGAMDSLRRREPESVRRGPADARPLRESERRVCRTGGWPRGWVATSYEEAQDGECARRPGASNRYNAAIIVALAAQPVGSVLTMCADQVIPRDWEPVHMDVTEEGISRCPGAGDGERPDVRQIRRVR